MRRTKTQGRETRDRTEAGGGGAKARKKLKKSYRCDVDNGEDSGRKRENVDKGVLVR